MEEYSEHEHGQEHDCPNGDCRFLTSRCFSNQVLTRLQVLVEEHLPLQVLIELMKFANSVNIFWNADDSNKTHQSAVLQWNEEATEQEEHTCWATVCKASLGQAVNQSIVVQFTSDGNFRSRSLNASPTYEKDNTTWRFFFTSYIHQQQSVPVLLFSKLN